MFAALALAQGADAETPQGLDFVWRAPAGCPSREFVHGKIRELLGESADRATHLHVQGDIVRTERGYRLTLTSRDDAGSSERIIEADSCSDLAGAAAVAIGLLIRVQLESPAAEGSNAAAREDEGAANAAQGAANASAARRGSAGEGARKTARRAPEKDLGEASRSAANDESSESYPRFAVQAPLVGIDVGPLPKPHPTLGLALGLRFPALELSLGAHASRPQTTWVSGVPRYGAELTRATMMLQACHPWRSRHLEGGPCLHVALDRLSARGVGDEVASQTRHVLVFGAGAGGLGRWRFSDTVGFIVTIAAQLEASRPRLFVDGLNELEKLAPLAVTAKSGLEWTW